MEERKRREPSEKLISIPPIREKVVLKQPNKKKHEDHLDQLHAAISSREEEKRILLDELRQDRDQVHSIKLNRDEINKRKNTVFEKLDFINKEVQKKGDTVQKLRGGIVYQSESEINEQIRKLEYQIQKNNFKLADEKRIVSEIDRLKRSKKILKDYNLVKNELDSLRNQQRSVREERETLFKESRDLRRSEEQLRFSIKDNSTRIEVLKEDVDNFREEKRSLINTFKEQDAEYRLYQKQKRDELKKKIAEESAKKNADERKEEEELRAEQEPYHDEKTQCILLIQYCENLLGSGSQEQTPLDSNLLLLPSSSIRRRSSGFSAYSGYSDSSSRYATPLGCTPVGTPLNGTPPDSFDAGQSPGFYKKKDESELQFFPGSRKKSKKVKSERKMSLKKSLSHNTETFRQFGLVKLAPPSSLGEVNTVMELLRAKLKLYRNLGEEERMKRDDICVPSNLEVPTPVITVEPYLDTPPCNKNNLTLNLQISTCPQPVVENTQNCDAIRKNEKKNSHSVESNGEDRIHIGPKLNWTADESKPILLTETLESLNPNQALQIPEITIKDTGEKQNGGLDPSDSCNTILLDAGCPEKDPEDIKLSASDVGCSGKKSEEGTNLATSDAGCEEINNPLVIIDLNTNDGRCPENITEDLNPVANNVAQLSIPTQSVPKMIAKM